MHQHESAPLLRDGGEDDDPGPPSDEACPSQTRITQVDAASGRVLPLALLASLAMASTAATSLFAYAALLCKDSQHCREDETSRYAGFVAGVTSISNVIGMAALGYLQKLAANGRAGLMLWLICRSMSVAMLLVGVSIKSIYVALSGRIFEGLASDNLLHFMLNSVYSRSASKEKASSLIMSSLALYMLGISISPFIAGLLGNFIVSFFMALGLFAVSIMYTLLCVPGRAHVKGHPASPVVQEGSIPAVGQESQNVSISSLGSMILTPLRPFRQQPTYAFIGLSLLAYNVVQSYIFSALMVHTSVHFGFTGRENGFLISMVHSVAAFYIVTNIYLIPWVSRWRRRPTRDGPTPPPTGTSRSHSTRARDAALALTSLAVQGVALAGLGLATQGNQVYFITVLLAVGLPAPSFIKAFFISLFDGEEKPVALAALAMMENLGSLLGPSLLGGLQAYFGTGSGVFFVAAGVDGASLVFLCLGLVLITTVMK
ncbi:hypothetical protein Daus18300_010634 [Diaporthe australafricana]|uniref:Major facilitator superfamily transporter n=1 Tax=Diaporthe australafricana TaxID=127596 RepID=A0ABR3WAH5_9PEZI